MAARIGAVKYLETSALTGEGVRLAFAEAAEAAILQRRKGEAHRCCVIG